MAKRFQYSVFGLQIRSEIELPELFPADFTGSADVSIELRPIPAPIDPSSNYFVNGDDAWLTIEEVARFWISGGSRIYLQPEPDAFMPNVRLYLLGSAMGLLLHQRGSLPLHANAVEIDGRAFAFIGRSGAGKSTLAAAFHDRGFRVIADDVCVVQFDNGGTAFACPGIPRLRLWEEALTATGRDTSAHDLSYAGYEGYRKYDVPIGTEGAGRIAVPLAAVYRLAAGPLGVHRLEGAEAADTIFANTYRGGYIRSAGNPRAHWLASLQLISAVPIFELVRPLNLARMADDLSWIIRHAEGVSG